MKTTKVREKNLSEIVRRKYDGLVEEFSRGFEELVKYAIENAVNARDFVKVLMPLLRKSMVWVDPDKVEAVSVELGRWDEVVVRIYLQSREIKITKHNAEVLMPSVYVETG